MSSVDTNAIWIHSTWDHDRLSSTIVTNRLYNTQKDYMEVPQSTPCVYYLVFYYNFICLNKSLGKLFYRNWSLDSYNLTIHQTLRVQCKIERNKLDSDWQGKGSKERKDNVRWTEYDSTRSIDLAIFNEHARSGRLQDMHVVRVSHHVAHHGLAPPRRHSSISSS